MARIKVEIVTTDLSLHKDINLLKAAFGPFYNWGVKSVEIVEPDHIEIDLKQADQMSVTKKQLVSLLKHMYGDYSKGRLAQIMGMSISDFKYRFDEYLDEQDI